MKRHLTVTATVIVMVASLMATGCVGQFALFNKLAQWNMTVTDNKFINEVVFLVLNFIPVYGIAGLADAVVINSIEFWTGENPILVKENYKKTVQSGDQKVIQTFRSEGDIKIMVADFYHKDSLTNTLMLSQKSGSSQFHGILVASDGTVENFSIRSEEERLLLTRFDQNEKPTMKIIEGSDLTSLSENVGRLINTPKPQRVSAP